MALSPPPAPTPIESSQKPQGARTSESRKGYDDHGAPQPSSAPANQTVSVQAGVVSSNSAKEKSKPSTGDRWIIIFTGVLAFMAICQLGAMLWQAKHMRDQARIMEGQSSAIVRSAEAATKSAEAAMSAASTAKRALETLERADVLIRKVIVSSGDIISEDTEITVVLKNYGRTRATKVDCSGSLSVVGMQYSPIIGTRVVPSTIGAGATYDGVRFESLGLDADTIDGINGGHLELQLTVGITYGRVFDETKSHITNCVGSFQPDAGKFRMRQTEVA
jgi:hypothetical protein